MNTITIRKMPFEFNEEIDPIFIEGEPELSLTLVAASLLLPHLEPYLIRSMRTATEHVTDPTILDGLKKFSAQEGQHYRMHAKFNSAIRFSGYPRIEEFERELEDDYKRFSETKSLRWNLAYAEGFEAFTMNSIRMMMEPNGFDNPDSTIIQMFEWHFVEELEHRTVAFDVYDHVCGGYWYRLAVGAYAQWHFSRWIAKVSKYMIAEKASAATAKVVQITKSRSDLAKGRPGTLRQLMSMLPIYLPGYTPHDIVISPQMQLIADKYSAMATSTS